MVTVMGPCYYAPPAGQGARFRLILRETSLSYRSAGLSPDGRFAFACNDPEGPLRLLDTAGGAEFGLFEGRNAVGLDAQGKLVPAYLAPKSPEAPRYWNGQTSVELDRGACRLLFAAGPSFVAPAADGRSALACPRGECGFAAYDLRQGRALWTAKAPDAIVAGAYSPDGGRVLGARSSNEVFLLDVSTGAVLWRAKTKGLVQRLTFSPDGRYAFAYVDWTSRQLWETGGGAEVAIGEDCDLAAVRPDGALLVGRLDLADPKPPALRSLSGEAAAQSADLRFFHSKFPILEDARTIVIPAVAEERLRLRDLVTGWQKGLKGKALHKDDHHSALTAARSPDGRLLATADRELEAAWDLESWRQTDSYRRGRCPAVSRDAGLLLCGAGRTLFLFEAASLKRETAKLRLDPGDSFTCAAFGEGGLFVAGTAKGLILHGRASVRPTATELEKPPPPLLPKPQPSGSPGVSILYVGPPEGGGTDDPEHWLAAGDGHRAQGELEQAAACYQRAAELDPRRESAWGAWSRCLGLMQRFDEACAVADQALAIDPGNGVHLTNKGMFLIDAGRFAEALVVLEQAVRAAPKNAGAWLLKGGCEVTLDKLLQAARSRRVLVLHKLPFVNEAQKASSMKLSIWVYSEVKKRSASFDLACRAVEEGRLEEALPLFDAAMGEFPEWPESWADKGLTLCKLGRLDEAVPVLERAHELDPSTGAWRNWMICLSKLGRDAEALACVQRRLEAEPADAETWLLQGMSLRRLGRLKEAVVSFSKALEHDPDNREILQFRAQTIKELSKST